MKPVHSFVVTAHLPEKIEHLKELAYNYWWCWDADARDLFQRIDRKLWEEVNHNPVLLINKLTQEKLEELSQQSDFTNYLGIVHDKLNTYLSSKGWFSTVEESPDGKIAYFSPEYGINESFPIYSGGLGVLSGDHLKSSSDLGVPLIGVGLLYQQGYFRQHLAQNGWQNELYLYNDFYSMPLTMVRTKGGEPLIVDVDLPKAKAYAQVWRLNVGKIPLYLLDTNISMNKLDEYRDITDQLYGGTRDTRIQQEIILGIGGMRALKAMDIVPDVVHINEGHAAFSLLERTKIFMEKYNCDFISANQITKSSSVFTTHTPVPAGNEVFKLELIEKYFEKYYKSLKVDNEYFISLGQVDGYDPKEEFSMTILGLKLTGYCNGVSKLHGKVARKMWHHIWKCFPDEEVPIHHITNGIHNLTWIARDFADLYDRYLTPLWRTETDNPEVWKNIDIIPNEELWREKQRRRTRLVLFAREHLKRRQKDFLLPDEVNKINDFLDPDALTIGFARRFATYKRALLLFNDMPRLVSIFKSAAQPVQMLVAGKAHPHDIQGKEVIQGIINRVREFGLERHIVFLEDYDLVIARLMVKGCDVWLNNPIRPQEASGTSGMKAAINGTLNLSILDGWWEEAFNSANGFAIGEGEMYANHEEQNIIESQSIYNLLENVIKPMFYNRPSRVPNKWVNYMKNCIKTISPQFSTARMIKEYSTRFYIPAMHNYRELSGHNAKRAAELKNWKDKVRAEWEKVEIIDTSTKQNGEALLGKPIDVSTVVSLGKLTPEDVIVQVYYGTVDPYNELKDTKSENLELVKSEGLYHYYEGSYICPDTGMQGFTIRILPNHSLMVDPAELYLCAWAK
ncbi:MAG: alpha-glucan phosphorylase [Ignavibacteria bacterium]|nr:alpha-glucan phosphorylase [Ignavibacteria bacterium]